ncbi:MAG TPA: hypothetical protein VFQ53_42210 [Kofleriaceae bacterium]|nr:hypothetical protein [Kofleriaceae bacterium]
MNCRSALLACLFALAAACGGSSRSTYARYPGAPATFDRATADQKAVAIADKMLAAAGGQAAWDKAKQIRWKQTVTTDGKVGLDGEEAWDRWNARHWGKLMKGEQNVVVGYELYGKFSMGFIEDAERPDKKQNLDDDSRQKALKTAKDAFNIDTALLCMPFLMLEPGTTLKYIGPAKDEAGNETLDQIQVNFADPLRTGLDFHVFVDRTSNLPQRIEILKTGTTQKIGFTLADWTTAGGLKFATKRTNLGYSGEVTTIANIRISEPEDELFIAPL